MKALRGDAGGSGPRECAGRRRRRRLVAIQAQVQPVFRLVGGGRWPPLFRVFLCMSRGMCIGIGTFLYRSPAAVPG
jgi:hypothetical protein